LAVLWVVLGIIVVLIVIGIAVIAGMYNTLVKLRNQVKNAWAQIDVQLKRRYDLIPNLIETVKGYRDFERETLEAVVKARNVAMQASSSNAGAAEQGKAEGELSGALARLMVVVERYPELKANQNFLALQEELTSTENKISFSRQYYNDSVMRYNNQTQVFPSNIIAGMFGFKTGEFFEVTVEAERQAPKVSFK
jgi:LemA protein